MPENYAQTERAALCDLFIELGPDAPTLCAGWTTRDMAAHLVVRESRPDAALGILAAPFASYGERVRKRFATKDWDQLVSLVRNGPPIYSVMKPGFVDRAANTSCGRSSSAWPRCSSESPRSGWFWPPTNVNR